MSVIGVVGVGQMGRPVCTRLVQAGFRVVAADREMARQEAVEAAGAVWERSARTVAQAVDVLVTVLPGSPEVEEVMGELLPELKRDTTWVDLSSTAPKVNARLRSTADRIECVDAPMGGGPEEARTGTLELFVGGTSESVVQLRELFEAIGRVHHVGGPGAGVIVKHLVNLLWFGQAVATSEALLLARRTGLDLEAVRNALMESAADSRFIRQDLPSLLDGDYLNNFGLDRCYEELEAITELAGDLDLPFELSSVVRDLHERALKQFGPRRGELLAVAQLESQAGAALRRT
jgi:3-hydroxyisobutyrate dehydrogenase